MKSGNEAAEKGEWLEARRNFEEGMETLGDSVDANVLLSLALVLFQLEDTEAYFGVCETWVERYRMSDDPSLLRGASRLCLGLPALLDKALWQEAIAMARRSLEGLAPESSDYQFAALALGLAEIREGNLDPAMEWLEIAEKGPDNCRIPAHAYHAIGAARAGQLDEAVRQLGEAEESLARLSEDAGPATSWIGAAFAEMAIREARAAIVGGGSE